MKISKKLIAAYKSTDFIFYPNNSISILKVGKKKPLLDALLLESGATEAAFITPWNPRSKILSFSENQKRMKRLVQFLKRKNYTFIYGIGRSKDGRFFEDSVLIFDISFNQALTIGKKYEQNAIVTYKLKSRAELKFCFES